MEEEEFWNTPKRMRIRESSSKFPAAPVAGVVFLIIVHFIYSVFSSPGEAAKLLGLIRLLLNLKESPSHTGLLTPWFLSCSVRCEEEPAPEPWCCEHWCVHLCR